MMFWRWVKNRFVLFIFAAIYRNALNGRAPSRQGRRLKYVRGGGRVGATSGRGRDSVEGKTFISEDDLARKKTTRT